MRVQCHRAGTTSVYAFVLDKMWLIGFRKRFDERARNVKLTENMLCENASRRREDYPCRKSGTRCLKSFMIARASSRYLFSALSYPGNFLIKNEEFSGTWLS
jgi:hypothetical protein